MWHWLQVHIIPQKKKKKSVYRLQNAGFLSVSTQYTIVPHCNAPKTQELQHSKINCGEETDPEISGKTKKINARKLIDIATHPVLHYFLQHRRVQYAVWNWTTEEIWHVTVGKGVWMMTELLLAACSLKYRCRPSSQQAFWNVIAAKAQLSLITLQTSAFHLAELGPGSWCCACWLGLPGQVKMSAMRKVYLCAVMAHEETEIGISDN